MEQISPRGLSNEVWYLIVRQFLSQEDLLAVCAVSEFFRALATPVLYRSVVLRSFRDNKKITLDPDSGDIHDESATFGLYCHLMNEENTNLRAWVRDVTLAAKQTREDPAKSLKRLDDFTGLVKILPNLENIYLKEELPLTDMFLDTIRDHENSPRLHLFHEIGRTKVDRQVPSLRTLSISISPDFIRDGDPEDSPLTLAPRELFLAFLNLQTLVISVQRRFGGCVMGPRHPLYFSPLNLLEKESFPPLESLSLSGYYVYAEEMLSWRTKLPWQTLRSLHLTENKGFLKSITGSPLLLKELVIFEAEGTTDGECGELEQFLLSFDTLERLDVTGKLPRMDAVAHHPALNHLRLHEIEEHDTTRSNLALEDVQLLDQECRCLQSLEIDITWDDGWPEGILAALAKGFTGVRHLRLHVASDLLNIESQSILGSDSDQWKPPLSEATIATFVEEFLRHRNIFSQLHKITLKSGENKRWFPQWPPRYANLEEKSSKVFEICFLGNECNDPVVTELESDYMRQLREISESIASRQFKWGNFLPGIPPKGDA